MERAEHSGHDYDICTHSHNHANMLPCMHIISFYAYLCQIGSDQRDQGIYGIRRLCQTCLSTSYYLSMQASVHAL